MPSSICRTGGEVYRTEHTAVPEGLGWRVTGDLFIFRGRVPEKLRAFSKRADRYGRFEVIHLGTRLTFRYEEESE